MEKILIIRTDIDEKESSRCLGGVDSAITMELYKKYNSMGISANHIWAKYTFIDEEVNYVYTFDSMQKLIKDYGEYLYSDPLGKALILSHEQWLDKANPEWRKVDRYQYW